MKLNTLLKTLGFLALAATPVVAGTAPAPKQPAPVAPVNDDLGMNIGLGYHTNYIWRGLNFGQNWVNGNIAGVIPLVGGASEDGAGGTRLVWDADYGSFAGDQDHFTANGGNSSINASFERLQLGAAIQQDLGPVTLSLGYRYFRNMGMLTQNNALGNRINGGMNDGNEISLGLATALGPINLASSANYDISNDSWYFDIDANTNIAVTDAISIVPFANVGYGKNMNWQFANNSLLATNASQDVTGWTALTAGVRLPIKLNSRATLTPYIAANVPLGTTQNMGGTALRANLPDTAYQSVLFGGVTINVRF